MKTRRACILVSLAMIFLAFAVTATAADTPTDISADRLQYDMDKQTVLFEGNVQVTRPDVSMRAERISIRFANKGGASADQPQSFEPGGVEFIEATTNVVINYSGRQGTCSRATYDVPKGLLTMEGNPVIKDGGNRIQGHTIRFNFKDNRSEVLGGAEQRVKAVFSTPDGLAKVGQ